MSILKWLDERLEEFVLVIALIVLSALTSLNVVLRYVFNASLTWSEEVCKLSLIVSGFFSIAYCVRRSLMIKVDVFIELMDKRFRFYVELVVTALMFAFFISVFLASINVVRSTFVGGQLSAALRIPMYWVYLIPSIGFALAFLRLIQRTVELMIKGK